MSSVAMATGRPSRRHTKPFSTIPYLDSNHLDFTPPPVRTYEDLSRDDMSEGDSGSDYTGEQQQQAAATSHPGVEATQASIANVVHLDAALADDNKVHEKIEFPGEEKKEAHSFSRQGEGGRRSSSR